VQTKSESRKPAALRVLPVTSPRVESPETPRALRQRLLTQDRAGGVAVFVRVRQSQPGGERQRAQRREAVLAEIQRHDEIHRLAGSNRAPESHSDGSINQVPGLTLGPRNFHHSRSRSLRSRGRQWIESIERIDQADKAAKPGCAAR
jgi:hypothetical protein